MADQQPDFSSDAIDWSDIGYQLGHGVLKRLMETKIADTVPAALAEGAAGAKHAGLEMMTFLAAQLGTGLHAVEEPFLPVIAAFVQPIIAGLFGADINQGALRRSLDSGAAQAAGKAIVDGFLRAAVGDATGELTPGTEGSERVAAAAVTAALESTFNAIVPELLSDLVPFDLGHFTAFTELPDEIIRTLGVSRLVRRALTPFINATCTTPATWALNKRYRPTLLGASTLARLIARNPDDAEKWREDLRRDGYSEDRIDALLRDGRHYFSAADVRTFTYRNYWTRDAGLQHLRDQGYDEQAAEDALRLEGLKRFDELEGQEAAAIISAYVSGDIDRGTLLAMLGTSVTVDVERTLLTELADVRRAANVKQLSPAQVADLVRADILAIPDYRAALARVGYVPDAIDALDLLLRKQIDDQKTVAQHRAEQAAAKAAAAAATAAARAAKLAAVEQQRAIAALGPEAKLEDAAVRGLIPLARVQAVYDAKYPPDAADILGLDLAARRQDYVDKQAAADAAAKRAALRGLNVGQLEAAVYAGAISVADFRKQLDALQLAPADADILTATVSATLAARAAAKADRDAAAKAAKVKHIDLGRMETLVRRGHRTIADYRALLASLGYDDGSIAGMVDLLQLDIDADAKAAALRAAAAAKAATKTLSLDQERRAIVLGLQPISTFTPWLLAHGFSADDAATLLGELQRDVDEAAAAAARRALADRAVQAGRAPLSDVRRAARLGLIPIDVYFERLTASGYTDDDISIESDLLTTEIAKSRTLQSAAADADAAAPTRGLTLAQLQAAVLAGTAPIADYTARALQLGFGADDAQTLTDTLQATIDATAAARARKQQLADENATRELARADVEKAVKQGLKTLDDYRAWLLDNGYADDDAALLVAELSIALGGPAA